MNVKKSSSNLEPSATKNKTYFYLISFIEGAAVMAVELLSAKMIAPFYGNSIYVWASVLGVTLGGLASGYFLGGIVSKKFPGAKTLFYVIFAASLAVFLMPLWGNLVLKMTLALDLITASLVSCIMFLLPPLVFFGMTSPIIINLLTKEAADAGKVSGTVYAVSTVGGILMTFITGFYLIPQMGIKASIFLTASILFLLPFIYFISSKKFLMSGVIIIFFVLMIGSAKKGHDRKNSHIKILHKSDGLQGQVLVADDQNMQKRSLHINNISQTFMHTPTGRSQWQYVHRIAMYSSFKPAGSTALVCGLGGGNLVNEFHNLGFAVDAVELDPRMEKLAKKFFYMRPDTKVYTDDARHYVRTTRKKYDIVVLDMSAGENQPNNVYTIEGFKEIAKVMKPEGILFLHYQNVLQGEHATAALSLGRTIQEAGLDCKIIETGYPADQIGEVMFFASRSGVNLEEQSFERRDRFADPFNFPTGKDVFRLGIDFSEGMVLTDNMPIMDFLHANTLDQTRGSSVKHIIPILLQEDIEIIE